LKEGAGLFAVVADPAAAVVQVAYSRTIDERRPDVAA
jgi:hypothetical protein